METAGAAGSGHEQSFGLSPTRVRFALNARRLGGTLVQQHLTLAEILDCPRRGCHKCLQFHPDLARTDPSLSEIAIFSGSAHLELAAEICAHLQVPLLPSTVERFANDCFGVQLDANCRERDVFLIQPLVPAVQEHLVELFLMLDAARGRCLPSV